MEQSSQQQIEMIVGSLEAKGTPAAPVEESLALARSDSSAVRELAIAVIDRFPEGGTFLDAALSYLPDKQWKSLVSRALDRLAESGSNEAAESIIAYSSLMSPTSLHSELGRMFHLQPNSSSYYALYPWRESGELHFEFLQSVLANDSSSDDERSRAWGAMLQTRHLPVVQYAVSKFDAVPSPDYGDCSRNDSLRAHLNLVGFNNRDGELRRMCPEACHHIVFDESFFEDDPPPWLERLHPSWTLQPCGESVAFGGDSNGSCSLCQQRLHRLLFLDPAPPNLGVTGRSRLELATCLSCLGWEAEALFYKHDEAGSPESVGYDGDKVTPEFPVGPLKQAEARLANTPRKWYWQDWGLSNSRENLNRIGGEPCWIQDSQYPSCPVCSSQMNFLMQLDSELPTADGGEWLWGSGGICYGFWCDDCKVSGFLWQCT